MERKKKQKSHLPLRLNILFFFIFLLFTGLILQLGVIQILYGEEAQEEIDRTDRVTSETPVPRGKIYDRNGELVVGNEAKFAITYTPKKHVQPEDNLEIAEVLVQYMDMDTDSVRERDLKDYWILKNKEEAYDRLTESELELSDREQYELVLERIEESDINGYSEEELKVVAIKRELDRAFELSPHIIKNEDISREEYAIIAENLHELPGINVTTDWEREYLYDGTFRNFIGSITTQQQGIPHEREAFFLSRDYSRNDRVGNSGIEQHYETYLNGQKEVREHITDSSGSVVESVLLRDGQRGNDLVLSTDIELQETLDRIVQEEVKNAVDEHPRANRFLKHAIAILINPNTGELLAISGQGYDPTEDGDDAFSDESFRALYDTSLPGSVVKGATVLAGLDAGVIRPNEVINDRRIRIAGDEEKGSWQNLGPVNDLDALKRSSNVYMFMIGLRMGGEFNYEYGKSVRYNSEGYRHMVNYFKQFGLGADTGIDFPYEETGFKGEGNQPYQLMDLGIGQYETYSALQLAQYISTIANGGYRMKPYLVKQIHHSTSGEGLGPLYQVNGPTVLNRIEMDQSHLERVQEGFRQVFQEQGGTGYRYFSDADYDPAGKTGTAESFYWEADTSTLHTTENLNLVGYAPFDEPEIAFAVMVPHTGTSDYPIHHNIGRRALDAYFDLKEERLGGDRADEDEEDSDDDEEDES